MKRLRGAKAATVGTKDEKKKVMGALDSDIHKLLGTEYKRYRTVQVYELWPSLSRALRHSLCDTTPHWCADALECDRTVTAARAARVAQRNQDRHDDAREHDRRAAACSGRQGGGGPRRAEEEEGRLARRQEEGGLDDRQLRSYLPCLRLTARGRWVLRVCNAAVCPEALCNASRARARHRTRRV